MYLYDQPSVFIVLDCQLHKSVDSPSSPGWTLRGHSTITNGGFRCEYVYCKEPTCILPCVSRWVIAYRLLYVFGFRLKTEGESLLRTRPYLINVSTTRIFRQEYMAWCIERQRLPGLRPTRNLGDFLVLQQGRRKESFNTPTPRVPPGYANFLKN